MKIASAYSFIYGSNRITLDDIADALRVTAIHNEDDIRKVEEVILECNLSEVGKVLNEVNMLLSELRNIVRKLEETQNLKEFKMLKRKGSTLVKELIARIERLRESPRSLAIIDEVDNAITEFKKAIE